MNKKEIIIKVPTDLEKIPKNFTGKVYIESEAIVSLIENYHCIFEAR